MTIKEARKALRELKKVNDMRTIKFGTNVKNGFQVKYLCGGFGICGWIDNSDPYHDYCDWSFGWSEKALLDMMLRNGAITA